jgi:hypothetical protein
MTAPNDFVAFILTNGRPDKVITYKTLRRFGYTGPIVLVVDNLDKTKDKYIEKYGNEVYVFDKNAVAKTFDQADNFNDMRAIIYARNACFDIAEELGYRYFIELDDDYKKFDWRFDSCLNYSAHVCRNLDEILNAVVNFYKSSKIATISLAQGGDFIGGNNSSFGAHPKLKRKCMNSFICSPERRFQFLGRVNEDVNTYTRQQSVGLLMFTTNHVSLTQLQTQSNSGGMTEMYLDSGTYLKSFYSVIFQPSSVDVHMMGTHHRRLHHRVNWKHTVPLILSEEYRK